VKGGCLPKEKSVSNIDAFRKNIRRIGLQIHYYWWRESDYKELLNLGFFQDINIQFL
jgi:hypothetical protein